MEDIKKPNELHDYKPILLQQLVERYITSQALKGAGHIKDGNKTFLVSEVLQNVNNFTFNQITKAIDEFSHSLKRIMLSYMENINKRITFSINPSSYDNTVLDNHDFEIELDEGYNIDNTRKCNKE